MKTISGIRPTGKMHLGNYIGSILPAPPSLNVDLKDAIYLAILSIKNKG